MALLDLFRQTFARWRTPAAAAAPTDRAVPVAKPSTEKLSKTVLPNATRTVRPVETSDGGSSRDQDIAARLLRPPGLPPAVALALEPKVERTISLPLIDLVGHIPDGYLKPSETRDPDRRVLLKAAEVEKGMAAGKPTVSLGSLYQQAPEIFLKTVPEEDSLQVPLPFDKVLAEFARAQVRPDQERDQAVPQVDTPILQATIEDNKKFGFEMGPLETSEMPPVKIQPASARAIAEAEPEIAVRGPASTAPITPPPDRPVIKLNPPPPAPAAATPPAPEPPRTPAPGHRPRIRIQLPPNGTGEPASERVPASSGLPVPSPARPTIKLPPTGNELRPRKTLVPGKETPNDSKPKSDDPAISLPLRSILQNIPPIQLNGSPSEVPAELRIQLPLGLVQSQLASGRVAIPVNVFRDAMPPQHRDMIVVDISETPVLLPLQDVLTNLPSTALKMREDQEEIEKGEQFETPFSLKAKEDAERFKTSDAPIAKRGATVVAPKSEKAAPAAPVAAETATAETAKDSPATPESGKEKTTEATPKAAATPEAAGPPKKLDVKEVVAQALTLPNVTGCSVTFVDGLILAGKLPDEVAVEGLCAMAPSLLQRIEKHMADTKLGALNSLTLNCHKSAVTFFMQGDICLTALHGQDGLGRETETKLAEMTKELSRTYAQPGT